VRFLADQMLGRLAKWLRFCGCDTLYPSVMPDAQLVDIAKKEDRILLTRDRLLSQNTQVRAIYINSPYIDDQLEQVAGELGLLDELKPFSRCGECNTLLEDIGKKDVKTLVPHGVFEKQDEFWLCPGCKRIYWRGTHWEKMAETIESLKVQDVEGV